MTILSERERRLLAILERLHPAALAQSIRDEMKELHHFHMSVHEAHGALADLKLRGFAESYNSGMRIYFKITEAGRKALKERDK